MLNAIYLTLDVIHHGQDFGGFCLRIRRAARCKVSHDIHKVLVETLDFLIQGLRVFADLRRHVAFCHIEVLLELAVDSVEVVELHLLLRRNLHLKCCQQLVHLIHCLGFCQQGLFCLANFRLGLDECCKRLEICWLLLQNFDA